MRLNQYLAKTTPLSRRAADQAIAKGEVTINGKVVSALGTQVQSRRDRVAWRGERLFLTPEYEYHIFYKPKQTMVTKSDPQGRATIWQRLPQRAQVLNAVGRLDYDTEGLLLLTDDGELLYRLTHPRFAVAKVYEVKVQGQITPAALVRLQAGLDTADERLEAVAIQRRHDTARNSWLRMTLHSGKYRQVRRMCEQVGYPVLKLKRIVFGPLHLRDLPPGRSRRLAPAEVRALRRSVTP